MTSIYEDEQRRLPAGRYTGKGREVKTLKLRCSRCGARTNIQGATVEKIIRLVDRLGWGGCDDICPACLQGEPDRSCDPE